MLLIVSMMIESEESCKRASDRHSPKICFCKKKKKIDEKNKEIFIYQKCKFVKKIRKKNKFEKN